MNPRPLIYESLGDSKDMKYYYLANALLINLVVDHVLSKRSNLPRPAGRKTDFFRNDLRELWSFAKVSGFIVKNRELSLQGYKQKSKKLEILAVLLLKSKMFIAGVLMLKLQS